MLSRCATMLRTATRLPVASRQQLAAKVASPATSPFRPVPRMMATVTRFRPEDAPQPQNESTKMQQQKSEQQEQTQTQMQPQTQQQQHGDLARGGDVMSDLSVMMPPPFRRMTDHMMQMQREMDSMMGAFGLPSVMSDPFDLMDRAALAPLLSRRGGAQLGLPAGLGRLVPLQVEEDDQGYSLTAEIPGFNKNEIKITLSEDGMLTMSGEHQEAEEDKSSSGDKTAKPPKSRRYTTFVRSIQLPEDAEVEGIKASTEHGVLSVHIPKNPKPAPKTREIPIA